jgi:hypothetical protein
LDGDLTTHNDSIDMDKISTAIFIIDHCGFTIHIDEKMQTDRILMYDHIGLESTIVITKDNTEDFIINPFGEIM